MLYFCLFIISTLLIYLLFNYLTRKNTFWKTRSIPGPSPVLLFGNIKQAALRKENMAVTFQKIYMDFPNESLVGTFRMTSPCVLIRDLDVIKNVMIKDFDKFEDRGVEFSKKGLGANLFHADGDTWRVLRNRFTPLFTSAKLRNMICLVTERCDYIMQHFENLTAHGSEIELGKEARRYSISTITACVFGLDIDIISDSLMRTLMRIDELTLSVNIFHEIDMMFPGLLKKFNSSLFPSDVQNFFYGMVKDTIAKRNGVPSGRNDFIDLILEMREERKIMLKKEKENGDSKDLTLEITESVIAAQMFVFFMAGYETSATVLSYLLFEIAQHPEIQDRLIKETDEVLQKYNGNITYDMLCDAPYMEQVFKETYRKYPLVPLQRKANTDYKVPGSKYTIEKDTMVVVSALGIHWDEKYYPYPDKFDPERFSPENINKRHPCSYLPYGIGPRNCIGIRFGRIQTRVFLLKFLSKYRVAPSEKTKTIVFDPSRILLSALGGVYVNIIRR